MKNLKTLVCSNIKRARKESRMSQIKLSEHCGWSSSNSRVSGYESGTSEPSYADIERIAVALNKPSHWFFQDHTQKYTTERCIPAYTLQELRKGPINSLKPHSHISINSSDPTFKNSIALQVKDGALLPEFVIGAYAVIKLDQMPRDGDYTLVDIGGEKVFKKLVEDAGKKYLITFNTYPAVEVQANFNFIGTAIAQIKLYS